jgi:alginate O-acetyltransferase complex protein AlgI
MLFNTATFLIFLVIVFAAYWLVAPKRRNPGLFILLVGSYIFYGWWDWRFLILIAFSSGSDFIIGKYLHKTENLRIRKLLLLSSILLNIGILFVFKYFNFFIDSFRALTGNTLPGEWDTLNIILPVGISFYTFQTLSYTIDIYRRRLTPTASPLTFFTFVSFFPQLVAGPIERAIHLIPQFEKKPVFSSVQAKSGLKLILWGLFKKMVIADQLAVMVNAIYGQPQNYGGLEILLATFAFGFQIYCDFSGYSDIAIGTARLFGIELMINFKTPYFAHSIRDFWQRWHISLSTWFRDYLFIPLGGSRVSKVTWLRNILITFAVSGLWHGASITFLVWGTAHGLWYAIEKSVSPRIKLPRNVRNMAGWLITFLVVNMLWIFFRAEDWGQVQLILGKILSVDAMRMPDPGNFIHSSEKITEAFRMIAIAFPVFLFIELSIKKVPFEALLSGSVRAVRWGFYYLILLMILFMGVLNAAPQFIYFQF